MIRKLTASAAIAALAAGAAATSALAQDGVAAAKANIEQYSQIPEFVAPGEPFDVPDGPTLAAIEDPEGNSVMLVQQ
ncbi:MAG: hypothetical protein AAFY28_18710 [Actinomycetota bacterium]